MTAAKRNVLLDIKREMDSLVGARIRVRANKGRRKVFEREGTLERTYPSLFVVRLDEDQQYRRVTYTYADLLTSMVELSLCQKDGNKKLQFHVG